MQFHDKRKCNESIEGRTCYIPPSEGNQRIVAAIMAGQAALLSAGIPTDEEAHNWYLILADRDPKLGVREHVQLNFEPVWLNDDFKAVWKERFGFTLRSELLENTEWKRYAWGVWEE